MARIKRIGTCHICGEHGPLSFEHVPPRRAFNDRPVVRVDFEEAMELGPDVAAKGPIQQRGSGGHTLCPRCNNKTGSWYGKHFIDWCYQGMDILVRSRGNPTLIHLNYLFPLPVIKQIATMFFSINSDRFHTGNQELVRFVLNREARGLSPTFRFFVYYNTQGLIRSTGVMAAMKIGSAPSLLSEFSYPPFGYMMTIDSDPPDNRLFEITHFAHYAYNEFKVMTLKLPVLPTHLAIPGDYRTKKEIYQQMRAQRRSKRA